MVEQRRIKCVILLIASGFTIGAENNLIDSFYQSEHESAPRFSNPAKMENAIKVQPTGGSVRLSCRATGVPEPQVAWFKNGQRLKFAPSNRENAQRFALTLTNLVRNDSGEYTCVVSNRLGSVQWTYTVEVHERFIPTPKIVCPFNNVTVAEGGSLSITCDVYSHLTAFVRWIKHYHINGSYFDRNGAPYAKLVKDAALADVTDPHTLTLHNVTLADSGFFSILASSPSGASHKTIEVLVVPKPFPGL
ncbi:fibroblast growth factor receptor 3 [Rhipicephalus microplus]|uniref:fibroblast growth factor receptor 3 n=1 Tax=Rhipicephalus microplus TaxID=6941 RepID=UPI001888E99B|nr:fibroblast growth factor receptor 3-like [Rhipicephalus microplus]